MSKNIGSNKSSIKPTKSRFGAAGNKDKSAEAKISSSTSNADLLFGKQNYMYILGGIGLMIIGFFLMAGGHNTDPNVFDPDVIYSTRRILIAPIFILAGLVVQVLAIFKK